MEPGDNATRPNCAVLGYGTIGSLLAGLLVEGKKAGRITVANRTATRLKGPLPPGLSVAESFREAVVGAEVIFLCVKPQACREVLESIEQAALPTALLVSAAADVSLAQLHRAWTGIVVRIMPTVTASTGRGVTLLCGEAGKPEQALVTVRRLFPEGLRFMTVEESRWNAVSSVTSCGPGLVGALLKALATDASARTGLGEEEVEDLVAETAWGALAWKQARGHSFSDLLARVATPGGVTGEGARILASGLPELFGAMSEAMEARHQARALVLQEADFLREVEATPWLVAALERLGTFSQQEVWLGAGAVAQTLWNRRFGLPLDHGIDDLDLVWFDAKDLTEDSEARTASALKELLPDIRFRIDAKNQARVHLWYQNRFGYEATPVTSMEDALSRWPTTATAIALRRSSDGTLRVLAPFGFDDVLDGVVRPNKRQITATIYEAKTQKWLQKWPDLTVFPW